MELLMWLEVVYLWRLEQKEKAMPRNDKITEHTTYVPNQIMKKEMLDQAVEEYKYGLLSSLGEDSDPTAQSIFNELKVRAIDDQLHGRRQR
jgi:hypothetical protein